MDLAQIQALLGNQAATTGGLLAGIAPAFSQVSQGIQAEGDALQKQAQAQGVIKGQEAQGQLVTQQQNQTAASALGTNMGDAAPLTIEIQNLLRQSVGQLNKQQAVVADIEANNDLFTNPLGFLRDLVSGDAERGKLKALQDQTKTAAESLQMLNQSTQQTAATNKALSQTVSDASVLAVQENASALAAQAAAQTRQRLGTTRVQELQALQQMSAAQTSQYVQMFNMETQAEQRAFMREEALARREDRNEAKRLKLEAQQADEAMLAVRNAGASALGLEPINSLASWKTSIQLNKDREDKLFTEGQKVSRGFSASVGDNPISAIQGARQFGIPLSEPQQQLTKKIEMLASQQFSRDQLAQLYPDAKPQELMELMTDKKRRPEIMARYMARQVDQMRASVDPQNPTNLYAPAPLGSLVNRKEMQSNPFLSKYYLPTATTSPDTPIDGSSMAEFAMDAIKSGIPTDKIAEGIVYMGEQLIAQNNLTYNYRMFGLPPQQSLRIPVLVKGTGIWATGGFSGTVDITKPTDVMRMITQAQSELTKRERTVSTGGSMLRNMFP